MIKKSAKTPATTSQKTSSPVRVGLIGLGKLGLLHAAIVNGLKGSELVAVADPSTTLRDGLAQQMSSLATYDDYADMIKKEDLEAIVIASPTFLHTPMVQCCLDNSIPFLVEKPLGAFAKDTVNLVQAYEANPIVHTIGYMGRQIETFCHAKKLLNLNPLGQIHHIKGSMYVAQLFKSGKGWRYDKEKSGGGVLITQNSHLIDLLQWYFGTFASVSGHVKSFYAGSVEDFAHAHFKFENGITGFLDTSWSTRHHRMVDICIEIEGENGTLKVSDDELSLFLDKDLSSKQASPNDEIDRSTLKQGWTHWSKPQLFRSVEIDVGGPEYTHQDAAFIEAVRQHRDHGGPIGAPAGNCDLQSGHHVQEVIEAIYQSSLKGGSPVDPRELDHSLGFCDSLISQ